MSKNKRSNTDLISFEINLGFQKEQQKYVAELCKWLIKKDVYHMEYSIVPIPPSSNENCIFLKISSTWSYNLHLVSKKIQKLFPYDPDVYDE